MRPFLISMAALLLGAGSARTVSGQGGAYSLLQCVQQPGAIRCDLTFTPRTDGLKRHFSPEHFSTGQDSLVGLIISTLPDQARSQAQPVMLPLIFLDRQVSRLEQLTIKGTTLRFIPVCRTVSTPVTLAGAAPTPPLSSCLT